MSENAIWAQTSISYFLKLGQRVQNFLTVIWLVFTKRWPALPSLNPSHHHGMSLLPCAWLFGHFAAPILFSLQLKSCLWQTYTISALSYRRGWFQLGSNGQCRPESRSGPWLTYLFVILTDFPEFATRIFVSTCGIASIVSEDRRITWYRIEFRLHTL